jgi:hypothetical protein
LRFSSTTVVRGLLACAVALGASGASAATATADTNSTQATATTAPAFRQTIGVNAAPSWLDSPYGEWPRIISRIREMGATNIRAVAPISTNEGWNRAVWGRINDAVEAGLKFNFLLSYDCSMGGPVDRCIEALRTRVPGSGVVSVEWPNEPDHEKDPNWVAKVTTWGRAIHASMKGHPATRGIPILGPSLVAPEAPSVLGDQSALVDVGNLHPYTGGLSPSPEHMLRERVRMAAVTGNKPLVATEAGFHTVMSSTGGFKPVDEGVSAVYTVRTFLEHFVSGIQKTYVFQLQDHRPEPTNPEMNFGLLRHDGSPRPAFTAVKNLMGMVGTQGPSRPAALSYSIAGDTSDLRQLVLHKGDGTHLVVLWRTASIWNRDAKQRVGVAPRRLTVSLPGAASAEVGNPVAGPGMLPVRLDGGRATVELAGDPIVLQVRGAAGGAGPAGGPGGSAAGGGHGSSAARLDATKPRIRGLRIRRKGRRHVATFRVSEAVRAGARVDRRRSGSRRFRTLRRVTGKALKGGRRTVVLGRLKAGRHRAVITVSDAAGNSVRATRGFRVRR